MPTDLYIKKDIRNIAWKNCRKMGVLVKNSMNSKPEMLVARDNFFFLLGGRLEEHHNHNHRDS